MNKLIETERLVLRPLTEKDAEDAFEWLGNPMVNRYMPYSLYDNVNQVKAWISSIEDDENEFAFCLKESNKVIGAGSITYDAERNGYELGYNLSESYWGKGYATEAAKALIQWAYEVLGAHDFCSNHANANVASGNVIKKCGFQFEKYGQYSRFDGSETFEASFYRMHLD